jgi:DNA-binding MarR family transcriptional regulator
MEFQLLYEFLKSGKTQKAFAKDINTSLGWTSMQLTRQLRRLERNELIDINKFLPTKHTFLIIEVRKKRDMWLQAIEAYNEAFDKLEYYKPVSIEFTREELNRLKHWYSIIKEHNQLEITKIDQSIYSKL